MHRKCIPSASLRWDFQTFLVLLKAPTIVSANSRYRASIHLTWKYHRYSHTECFPWSRHRSLMVLSSRVEYLRPRCNTIKVSLVQDLDPSSLKSSNATLHRAAQLHSVVTRNPSEHPLQNTSIQEISHHSPSRRRRLSTVGLSAVKTHGQGMWRFPCRLNWERLPPNILIRSKDRRTVAESGPTPGISENGDFMTENCSARHHGRGCFQRRVPQSFHFPPTSDIHQQQCEQVEPPLLTLVQTLATQ